MMNGSWNNASGTLPDPIVLTLRRFIRRIRRLIVLRGLCATAAVAGTALLLVMGIDASLTLFAQWPRWILSLLVYAVTILSCGWFLVRPLARSFTLAGAARLIEAHHPELQERISSVVELLTSQDLPSLRGSEVLIAALTQEAVRDAGIVQPRREVSFRIALPYVVTTAAVLVVFAGLWLGKPRQTSFLLARAVAPFLNLPNVYATDLAVEPGDVLVAEGSHVQIAVNVANPAVTSSRLRTTERDGQENLSEMVLVPATNTTGKRFVVALPGVARSFRYRVHAGDALSRYYTVKVSVPPIIEQVDVAYSYPAYSGLAGQRDSNGSGTIRALAGSTVTVTTKVNKTVPSAALRIDSPAGSNTVVGVARTTPEGIFYDFAFTMPKNLTGLWSVHLQDDVGLGNAPFAHTIQSIADRPPIVQVVNLQQKEIRLNRDDRVPVVYTAEDDLGLRELALVVYINVTNATVRPQAFPTNSLQVVRAVQNESVIELSDPLFTNVARFAFQIRATDSLPPDLQGPQRGASEMYVVVLDANVQPWREQVLTSQEQRLRQGLQQAQKELSEAKAISQAVREPVAREPVLSTTTAKQVDQLQDRLAGAGQSLHDVVRAIDGGYYENLATNLAALADEHVGKAENEAGQIKLVDEKTARVQLASNVTAEIDTSLAAVDQALKDLNPVTTALRQALELDHLADRQAELAQNKSASELAPTNAMAAAMSSNDWKQAEERIAAALANVARETPGAPQALASLDKESAAQAAREAKDLAAQQTNVAQELQRQAADLQQLETALRDLTARQERLTAEARTSPLAADLSQPMNRATTNLQAGQIEVALKDQALAEIGLKAKEQDLLKAIPPEPAAAPAAASPKDLADSAVRKAAAAVEDAGQAARLATNVVETANQRQHDAEAQAKQAERAKNQPLAQELNAQASDAKQEAQQAAQWLQAVQQAADTVRQAAQETRQAADQAVKAPTPQQAAPAAEQALNAANRAQDQAEKAQEFAMQAAQALAEPDSAQDRAVRAADDAIDSARAAREDALLASRAAAEAQAKADQAQEKARQASLSGKDDPMREAMARAQQALERAAVAERSATGADRSADEAHQAAEQTQAAAETALAQASPRAAEAKAADAEQAARAADQAAQQAEQLAQAAQQAAQDPATPQQRAAKAVAQADAAVRDAEQAARKGQETAKKSDQDAAKVEQLVAQIGKTADQNELKQPLVQEATQAREQAQEVKQAADAVKQAADETRKAAQSSHEAASSITPAVPAAQAEQLAAKAEQAAQTAEQKAEQAQQLAEKAIDLGRDDAQVKQAAVEDAQQAAKDAAQASGEAQHAAQEAQQAAQQAAQTAQQAQQVAQQQAPGLDRTPEQRAAEATRAQQAAEATRQLANQSQQAAQQAAQQAGQAQQQAGQAAAQPTPQGAERAMVETEHAASAAQEAAQKAIDTAELAKDKARSADTRLQAQKLDNMALQQADIAKKTDELMDRRTAALDAFRQEQTKTLQAEQQKVAVGAAELAHEASTVLPEEARPADQAAAKAQDTFRKLAQGELHDAAIAADRSGTALGEVGQRLQQAAAKELAQEPQATQAPAEQPQANPAAARPEALAQLAERADDLADRQRGLQRQIETLAENRPLVQLAMRQDALSDQVASLAQQADQLRDAARDMGLTPPAVQQSAQAAQQLDQAEQQAAQAAGRLEQSAKSSSLLPSPQTVQAAQQAQQAQQATAQALNQAAQTFDGLASSLAATPPPLATQPPPTPQAQYVPQAYAQVKDAAFSQSAADAIQAAMKLAQAAEQAAAQARAMGANPEPDQPLLTSAGGFGINPMEEVSGEAPTLTHRIGLKLRDWLRLPGELRDEVLQAAATEGPEEYRPIIRRYFQEVSNRGGQE